MMNKPVGKQRPKPPPYPRPVPQLAIEELPPTTSDIAWDLLNGGGYYSVGDKQEHDEDEMERRAAKRRRIEICAQACLRGEPLYLMSAQLKGPFKKGWRNPWGKKRRLVQIAEKSKLEPVEIPETAKKIVSSVDEVAAAKIPVPHLQLQSNSRQSLRADVDVVHPARGSAPSPFTTRATRASLTASPKLPRKVKEKRVEEWLRTSEVIPEQNDVLVHSSPTPTGNRRKTPGHQNANAIKGRASQSEPPKAGSPFVDHPRTVVPLQDKGVHSLSRAEHRIQKLSREMQNVISEPVVEPSHDLQNEVRRLASPSSSSKSLLDSSRAEFAILQAKRKVLHTAPADAHMSPFEFKKIAASAELQEKQKVGPVMGDTTESEIVQVISAPTFDNNLADAIDGSATRTHDGSGRAADEIFMTAPQLPTQGKTIDGYVQTTHDRSEERVATSASQPALSNAVSDTNMTDVPPSAQPRPELDTSLSNLGRDEKLHSIKNIPTTDHQVQSEEIDKEQNEDVVVSITTKGAKMIETALEKQSRVEDVLNTLTPVPMRVAPELSTQEMLANIEPLEMSTIKKLRSSPRTHTPSTATKPKSDKKRKRTSFAVDRLSVSSFSSIKDVMKAKVSKKLGSPPPFLLGKADLDVDVSDEENGSQRKRSRKMSGISKPKGILKSANPSSSPNSIRKTKLGYSTGQEQDGEQRMLPPGSGQNGLDGDNFDLDAAIDDLGSFLGTWDAEKEASSLDIEA